MSGDDGIIYRADNYRHISGRGCRLKVTRTMYGGGHIRYRLWREGSVHDVGSIAQCEDCDQHWLCIQDGLRAWWRPISARRARRIIRKAGRT